MKNVLLINASEIKPAIPPLGLEYIAEVLRCDGYDSDIVDIAMETKPNKVIQDKIKNNPIAIGISIRNIDHTTLQLPDLFLPRSRELISMIKGLTNAPIILGGAGFCISPKEILDYVGGDIGVRGCSVHAMSQLLSGANKNKLKSRKIIDFLKPDYLSLSFRRDILNLASYQKQGGSIGVNTKSGCDRRCIYCTYPSICGNRVMCRETNSVIEEILNLQNRGVNKIFFADSVFNNPEEHAREICDKIIERGIIVDLEGYLNPAKNLFTKKLAGSIKKAGFSRAYLGIDSGCDRILKVYKKGFSVKEIEDANKICRDSDLEVVFSVLFGAPGENQESISETFDLIDRLKPDRVDIQTAIRVYAASKIAEDVIKKGIVQNREDLLYPCFYPFSLVDYIGKEARKRTNCYMCRKNEYRTQEFP